MSDHCWYLKHDSLQWSDLIPPFSQSTQNEKEFLFVLTYWWLSLSHSQRRRGRTEKPHHQNQNGLNQLTKQVIQELVSVTVANLTTSCTLKSFLEFINSHHHLLCQLQNDALCFLFIFMFVWAFASLLRSWIIIQVLKLYQYCRSRSQNWTGCIMRHNEK